MVCVTQLGQIFKQQWQTSFCFILVRKGYDAIPGTDIEKQPSMIVSKQLNQTVYLCDGEKRPENLTY